MYILTITPFCVGVFITGMHGKGNLSLHSTWHMPRQSLHFTAIFANPILLLHGPHLSGLITVFWAKVCCLTLLLLSIILLHGSIKGDCHIFSITCCVFGNWISFKDSLREEFKPFDVRSVWGSWGTDSITDVAVIGPSFVRETVVVAIILSVALI